VTPSSERIGADPSDLFQLDPDWAFLNHGSFGACPEPVFAVYQEWQRRLERQPVEFVLRHLPGLLGAARAELAAYVGADPEGLLFVQNVTTGVNAVARSLGLGPGDEVLATDHEYGALELMWRYLAARDGFTYTARPWAGVDDFCDGLNARTRVLFASQIASATAVHLPVGELCRRARAADVVSIVDGAHAPGHVDVDVEAIGPDYYAGNCHNWRRYVGRRVGQPRRAPRARRRRESGTGTSSRGPSRYRDTGVARSSGRTGDSGPERLVPRPQ
jgi:isopenicillin-N epimerase